MMQLHIYEGQSAASVYVDVKKQMHKQKKQNAQPRQA
jgi:hypothetical protein